MQYRHAAPAAIACSVLLLVGCGQSEADRRAAEASSVMAVIDADTSWVPTGMKSLGDVAWKWTDKSQTDCKIYQDDGCWGVTVAPRWACPGGVYIEIAVTDGGVVIDKANEITAALDARQTARAVLAPPGGSPDSAKAQVTTLSCLG